MSYGDLLAVSHVAKGEGGFMSVPLRAARILDIPLAGRGGISRIERDGKVFVITIHM